MSIIFTPRHSSWFLTRRRANAYNTSSSLHQGDERKQEEPTLSSWYLTWSHAGRRVAQVREGNNKHLLNAYTWSWGTWCWAANQAGTLAIPFRSFFYFFEPPAGLFSLWFFGCCCRTTGRTTGVTRLLWGWNLTRLTKGEGGSFQQSLPRIKLETMLNAGRGAILIGW